MAIGTTAAIIGAGIMAGGSVAGSALQSRAAGNAADTQSEAARQAAAQAIAAARETNPMIQDAVNTAVTGADEAAAVATGDMNSAVAGANNLLDPYSQEGRQALIRLTDLLNRPNFTAADMQMDPGFDFRLQEAQKAIERSAAARGGLNSGATAKALTRYSQNFASDEFGKAFERFQTQQNFRLQGNQQLVNLGASTAGQQGQNSIGGAQFTGAINTDNARYTGGLQVGGATQQANNLLSAAQTGANATLAAGNAQAAGQVASGNAWGNALSGGANNAAQLILLSNLIRRPTTPGGN